MSKPIASFRLPVRTVLLAWLVAGTLDLLGALLVYAVILQKTTAEKIVKGIASGVFKKQATAGGAEMILYGIGFHYLIALAFSIFFFFIFPYIPFFRKQKILTAIVYGAFIWGVMNLVILNIVFPGRPAPTFTGALIGAAILVVMIGLPLSYFANRYYKSAARGPG